LPSVFSHLHTLICSILGFLSVCTSTSVFYTLSLHDALPILEPASRKRRRREAAGDGRRDGALRARGLRRAIQDSVARHRRRRSRSEEHTSELQSRENLVCRLLLEKKNNMLTNLFNN